MLLGDIVQTAPTAQVLSVGDAKAHLHVLHQEHDAYITGLIDEAIESFETETGMCLASQTREATFDDFPCEGEWIVLPRRPVASVTWVKYYDTSGVQQTLASTQNLLGAFEARIVPPINTPWPSTQVGRAGRVTVRYVCGYATADAVPKDIIRAIKLMVGDAYENRGDDLKVRVGIPPAAQRIIHMHSMGTPA